MNAWSHLSRRAVAATVGYLVLGITVRRICCLVRGYIAGFVTAAATNPMVIDEVQRVAPVQ